MRKRDLEALCERYDPDTPDRERMRRGRGRARLTEQARARLAEQREAAVFDDGPAAGGRWSTWDDADERGPRPYPGWLVTELAAVDGELGILKTGKEADVFLLERALPATGRTCLMAAKRYRGGDHRLFHRDAGYLEGRRVRASREMRAMQHRTDFGPPPARPRAPASGGRAGGAPTSAATSSPSSGRWRSSPP